MKRSGPAGQPPADDERIARAVVRMRGVFASRPETALAEDAPAIATTGPGLGCEVAGPQGQHARTDMPAAIGGGETAPTPEWFLRAAVAASTATLIRLYAAEEGIVLDRVEVGVFSRSDPRGLLGVSDVGAACRLRTEIRLAAAGVPVGTLVALARRAQQHSPVAATIGAGDTGTVEIEIVG
jgi:uncharacterized OsmC-like protein